MEIHELLDLPKPVAELTDAELEAHLEKFFPDTRPKKPISHVMATGNKALAAIKSTSPAPKGSMLARMQELSEVKPKFSVKDL